MNNYPSITTAPKSLDDFLYQQSRNGGEVINLIEIKKTLSSEDFAKRYEQLEDEWKATELHKWYSAIDDDGVMWAVQNPVIRVRKIKSDRSVVVVNRKKKLGLAVDVKSNVNKINKKAKF